MNCIDVNILCISQKKPTKFKNTAIDIEVKNKKCNSSFKGFREEWDVLNNVKGIFYQLWWEDEKDVIDFVFEKCDEKDRCAMVYNPTDSYEFRKVVDFYISKSPIKKILIQFAYQGYQEESISCPIHVNDFFDMLTRAEIYGNVAYIVYDKTYDISQLIEQGANIVSQVKVIVSSRITGLELNSLLDGLLNSMQDLKLFSKDEKFFLLKNRVLTEKELKLIVEFEYLVDELTEFYRAQRRLLNPNQTIVDDRLERLISLATEIENCFI